MMSFSQLPAVKRHHFGKHDKQIFGPSYFLRALGVYRDLPNLGHPNVGDDKTWHVISKGSFISILQKSR